MVLSLIHFHSHFHPTHFISISPVSIGFYLWISIYGEKIHFDEATLHRRRLMIYFCAIAHGTHVHGNITPLMCALCLTEGEKAAHAYIMVGGTILRLLFFFFFVWLCDSFACWWKIDVNHSLWRLSSIHSLSLCAILLSWFTVTLTLCLLCFLFSCPNFTLSFLSNVALLLRTPASRTQTYLCHRLVQ